MDPMQNSASSYAPSTIIDVQCQNARNSTCAIVFELTSRLKSRSAILISTFAVYTILGAVIFLILEKSNDERRLERQTSNYDRKRYELSYRLDSTWKRLGGVRDLRSEWFNETSDHFKWYETEMTYDVDGREPFWNFQNSLFFSGASICTAGFQLSVLKTTLGRAVFICFSTFGIVLFLICSSRMGRMIDHNLQRFLYSCQKYSTPKPQMRSLMVYVIFVPAVLAGQHGVLYYMSECESYLDTFELHFYSISTIGRVDTGKCLNHKIVGRTIVFICIFLWCSTIWSVLHSLERQKCLLYEYLCHWLILQTDESLLQLMSSSTLLSYNNTCFSSFYSNTNGRLALMNFLRSALDENLYHNFLLKTLNRFQIFKLSKLYRKVCHRYSQTTQTDPKRRISRGTMTTTKKPKPHPPVVIVVDDLFRI